MHYILFTTTSCPKCPEVKTYVIDNVKIDGKILDETKPNFSEKTKKYGITTAPTILIFDENNNEIFRGSEVYEIEAFLKK